ncbi:chain-length determining protein, partial [Brevundimonas sp.]|uniref:chain-length determining protein n=1 Tax=Brevundimonas sp. TaxID=1871086 RepID=UPI0028B0E3BE
APVLAASFYFLLIATPRYVAEAKFVVRSATERQPSSLGVALQGVGIPGGQTDAFAVHAYINSRDGLRQVMGAVPVEEIYGPSRADPLSRVPAVFARPSFESLFKGTRRYISVGYDSTTGISTLRVQAFRPRDAQIVSEALLAGGESLVNRLNLRAEGDAVAEGERTVVEAQARVARAQAELADFRNAERFIDPESTATAGGELVSQLLLTIANLKAERSQIAAEAPLSPQLSIIDGRIRAYEDQVQQARGAIAGGADSLVPKISQYEQLATEREFAQRALLAATQALEAARLDSRRQKLYLERIVNPSRPDEPLEPKRWLSILAVLAIALTVYGTGWLIAAGLRESRQS